MEEMDEVEEGHGHMREPEQTALAGHLEANLTQGANYTIFFLTAISPNILLYKCNIFLQSPTSHILYLHSPYFFFFKKKEKKHAVVKETISFVTWFPAFTNPTPPNLSAVSLPKSSSSQAT